MVIGFYIEHSAGESLVRGNPLIHTYQGSGEYFVERTSDLNPGNRIPVESIKKSLPELEPLFLRSLRYRNAHEELHFKNSKGEYVKKLRVLLLRGLTSNDSSLENKIMRVDGDFSIEDYERFKDDVYALNPIIKTENGVRHMDRDSLDSWFTKNTALQDWENFALLVAINPAFRAIYESYGKEEGFHAAYMMYAGVRRHLRRRMKSDKPFKLPERNKNKPLTKLQEEIDTIVDMILAKYDDYFKAAILTKIFPIESEEEWTSLAEKLGASVVNVYTGKPRIKSYKEVDIINLLNTEAVLKECLGQALYFYFHKTHNIDLYRLEIRYKPLLELAGYFVSMATHMLVEVSPLERHMLYTPHQLISRVMKTDNESGVLSRGKAQTLDSMVNMFMQDLSNGRAEELVELPRHSLSNMADAFSKVRSSIPRSYYRWEELESDICILRAIARPGTVVFRGRFSSFFEGDRQIKRELRKEILIEIPMLEQYSAKLWRYLEEEYKIGRKKKFVQDVVDPTVSDLLLVKKLKEQAMRMGELFFTRDDVEKILSGYNLGDFIKLILPRNFI